MTLATTQLHVLFRSLVLAVAAILAEIAPAEARTLAEVASSKLLRVMVYEDNAPFSFRDAHGTMTGIDVEIAGLLAKALDAELELMPRPAHDNVDADFSTYLTQREPGPEPLADVIMHVALDRDVMRRNSEVLIGDAYFEERMALAYDPLQLGGSVDFELFRHKRIAVAPGSLADYFVTFAYEGALRPNIIHYKSLAEGVRMLGGNEVAGLLAVRSRIEAAVTDAKASVTYAEPALPGIAASRWRIGLAVKENAGDLAEFLGGALGTLKASGALEAISARYGVHYVTPEAGAPTAPIGFR